MAHDGDAGHHRTTAFQRWSLRRLAKQARKRPGEPLTSDDWAAYFAYAAQPGNRAVKLLLRTLPSEPRCGYCGAPFGGFGGGLVRRFGFQPSRKNPNICAVCVELAPPGGMTVEVGVLFADLRGFTSHAEGQTPAEVSALLRRFYRVAEDVLFPKALIDKVIGDEVMALYVPTIACGASPEAVMGDPERFHREIASIMVDHAFELLDRLGYGSPDGPMFEVGIGIDHGEAFIGNIGDGAVHDFTAVGDVVNTAARIQGAAGGGEVLLSSRVAELLPDLPGGLETVSLKGKADPVVVHRLLWGERPGG